MITFKQFLQEEENVPTARSLGDFVKIVTSHRYPPKTIIYKEDELNYGGQEQGLPVGMIFYHSKYTSVVIHIKMGRPFDVVYIPYDGDAVHQVIDNKLFVQATLGDISNKDEMMKRLLRLYRAAIGNDGDHDIHEVDKTVDFVKSLVYSLKKIGVRWPELTAIEKSIKS